MLDTIVNALGNAVGGLPAVLAAVGMLFVQFVVLGLTRQLAVLAYQFYLPVFAGWLVLALGLLTYAQLSGWS